MTAADGNQKPPEGTPEPPKSASQPADPPEPGLAAPIALPAPQSQAGSPVLSVIMAAGFGLAAVAMVIWIFIKRNLTGDERMLFMALIPLCIAVAFGAVSGFLAIQQTGQKVAVGAVGGGAALLLSYWLIPVPKETTKGIYVRLVPPAGQKIKDSFVVVYSRPKQESGRADGNNSEAPISGFPLERDKLEVLDVEHTDFETAEASKGVVPPWNYHIDDDNHVTINMVRKATNVAEPTKPEIEDLIAQAGLSKADILKPAFPDPARRDAVVLTIKNDAAREFALWLYDCESCYPRKPNPMGQASTYSDIVRMPADRPVREYRAFAMDFDNLSGNFAVYLKFKTGGKERQQFLGIHNFYIPAKQTLTISSNVKAGDRFDYLFEK
jgi:hypothetical protein